MNHLGISLGRSDSKSRIPVTTALRVLDGLRQDAERADARERLMLGSMLAGREVLLFGKRVKITLEWVEGLPGGFTEEDLRQMGERMYRDAGGQDGTGAG